MNRDVVQTRARLQILARRLLQDAQDATELFEQRSVSGQVLAVDLTGQIEQCGHRAGCVEVVVHRSLEGSGWGLCPVDLDRRVYLGRIDTI